MALLNTWASQQDQATLSPLSRLLNNYIQKSDAPLAYLMRGDAQGLLKDLNTPKPVNTTRDMTDLALNLNPVMGLLGATAFHGSPHIFNKFDVSKAGGNSGQDYGYGTYFSSSPEVANAYTTVINSAETKAKMLLNAANGNASNAYKMAQKELSQYKKAPDAFMPGVAEKTQQAADLLKQVKSGKSVETGNIYKVDIPDEYMPKMLNWSSYQQTPEVKEIFKKHGLPTQGSGEDLYFEAIKKAGSSDENKSGFQKAAEYLDSIGIKGVKYPNRAMDAQDYVLFNPSQVKMLETKKGLLK